jgi:uncharacterized protein YecE (DUF72 family)
MARVLVGLPALVGDVQKYAKRFDVVELRPVDTSTPRLATLRQQRKAVPPAFVFSVVLPRVVGALAVGPALDEALEAALGVAVAVEARVIVLQTPATVRPTAANRKRIAALFERLPQEGVVRAWEPTGVWEHDDVVQTAKAAGALAVFDAATEELPPGPVVYTRVRALGKAAALGATAIDRIASRLHGRREAFVIVDGGADAGRVKTGLGVAMAKAPVPARGGLVIRPGASKSLIAEDEEQ